MPEKNSLKALANEERKRILMDYNAPYDPLFVVNKNIKPQYLVFEGGGVKGLAYAGALIELERSGYLSDIKSVAGSSAGGLTAYLLGLGYTGQEIQKKIGEINFKDFINDGKDPWFDIGGIGKKIKRLHNLLFKDSHGISSGDGYKKILEDIMLEKFKEVFPDLKVLADFFPESKNIDDPNEKIKCIEDSIKKITFKQFDLIKKSFPMSQHKFKDIKFTGTKLSDPPETVIFGSEGEEKKDFSIVDAARITGSFPGMFGAVKVENSQGGIDYYVDGGVSNNFPTDIYDKRKYVPDGYDLTNLGANPAMLSFLIDNDKELQAKIWKQSTSTKSRKNSIFSYIKNIISALQTNTAVIDRHGTHTIQIHDKNVKTLQFDLSEQNKQELIDSGRETAKKYADNYLSGAGYENERYKNLRSKYEVLNMKEGKDCFNMFIDVYKHLNSEKKIYDIRVKELHDLLSEYNLENHLELFDSIDNANNLLYLSPRLDPQSSARISKLILDKPHLIEDVKALNKIKKRISIVQEEVYTIFRVFKFNDPRKETQELRSGYKKHVGRVRRKLDKKQTEKLMQRRSDLQSKQSTLSSPEEFDFEYLSMTLDSLSNVKSMEALISLKDNLNVLQQLIYINKEIIQNNYKEIAILEDESTIHEFMMQSIMSNSRLKKKYNGDIENRQFKKEQGNIRELFYSNISHIVPNRKSRQFQKIKKQFNIYLKGNSAISINAIKVDESMNNKRRIELSELTNTLESENEKYINKKYALNRQTKYYKAASDKESLDTLKKLVDLNDNLQKFIGKKTTFFTRILEKFYKPDSKIGKYSLFGKAYYLSLAKNNQKEIQSLLDKSRENWSISQMEKCKETVMMQMKLTRAMLMPNQSSIWKEDYDEIKQIFDDFDNKESYLSENDWVQPYDIV